MSRRRKKKGGGIKAACVATVEQLAGLRDLASDHGLTVRYSEVTCSGGRTKTYHVMFDDATGARVLNYWPGSGKTYSPVSGQSGRVTDCWAALDEAARIASISLPALREGD